MANQQSWSWTLVLNAVVANGSSVDILTPDYDPTSDPASAQVAVDNQVLAIPAEASVTFNGPTATITNSSGDDWPIGAQVYLYVAAVTPAYAQVTKYGNSIAYNPTSTTSTTYVMMGLNLVLSDVIATAAWITCDGQITNGANNGETDCVLCWGQGAAPVWGVAQAGTVVTQPARYKSTAAGDFVPFSLSAVCHPLTPGQSYWFDLAVKTVGTGAAQVMDVDFSAHGLA
jgi:hypothetical protein